MLKILVLVLASGLVLTLGSGCVLGTYAVDRANDFVDMFGLRVSGNLGLSLEANVRATELFQTGGGWSEKYVVGFKGRDYGVYKEQSYTIPFVPSDWFPWFYPTPFAAERSLRREPLSGTFEKVDSSRHMFMGTLSDVAFTKKGEATKYDRFYDEVGFSICAGLLFVGGLEAEVRLLEILDFVLGIFTIDPMKDDHLREFLRSKKSSSPKRPPLRKLPKKTGKTTKPPIVKKAPKKSP